MKTPSILLLAGTLLVAGSAAVLVRALMQPAPAPVVVQQTAPKPAPQPKQAILVAAHALQPGEFIDTAALTWKEVETPHSALIYYLHGQDKEQAVLGATVRQPVKAGEALTGALVVEPGQPGFIAAVIRPGFRAISVPTSAVASNSGLISTGDRVDVILSLDRDKEQSGSAETAAAAPRLAAQTLLRDVRVLAFNNVARSELPLRNDARHKDDKARRYSIYETVTLEVTPHEAEQLAVAREIGTLQLVVMGTRETGAVAASDKGDSVTTLAEATRIYDRLGSGGSSAPIQLFRGAQVEMQGTP